MKTIDRLESKTASALFCDIETHLLSDEAPSHALNRYLQEPAFDTYPFNMLKKLEKTAQSSKYHPEGNVWKHTMLVVDEAAKRKDESSDPKALMWAALLHDIGKPATTVNRRGKITAYDHDKVGAHLARTFLSVLTDDTRFIDKVAHLVRYHMQILYVVNDLPFHDIGGMKRQTDVGEVALLSLCDRLGRGGASSRSEYEQVKMFVDLCDEE
ncbi:HDIG domain-containing metalloprotein [Oscillospiraceae bacterium WX1]